MAGQAGVILAARLVSAAATAGLTILLARALGTDGFGGYALALSIAGGVSYLADLGVSDSAARFVAERVNMRLDPAGVLRIAFRIKVALGLAVFGALFAFAEPIANLFDVDGLASLLRVAAVAGFAQDVFTAFADVFEAMRRAQVGAMMAIVKAAFEVTTATMLVLAGLGAGGALAGNAIGYSAGAALGLAMIAPRLVRSAASVSGPGTTMGGILGYGLHVWVAGLAWEGLERIDQILLGAMRGAAAVAEYESAWRFAAFLALAGSALGAAVGPRMAAPQDRSLAGGLMQSALRVSVLVYVPISCVTAVTAVTLVPALLGADYRNGGVVLAILTPFIAILGVAPVLSNALDYLGEGSRRKWLAIVALCLNLALDLVLIPSLGVFGPAVATNVAVVVYVGGLFWIASRRLDIGLARLAVPALRAGLAGVVGAALAGAIIIAGAGGPSVLVAGSAWCLGVGVSGAILAVFGEVSPRSIASRTARWARR